MDGRLVDVEVKPLDVLHQLLLRPGEVVTKGELLEAVWPSTQVVEGSLATAVSKLRKALRPYEDVVVTLPRAGYLLSAAPVRREAAPDGVSWPQLELHAADAVPGRPHWLLEERLSNSPYREVWLARNPKTGERRVFKFALDEHGLQSLKREAALARLIGQETADCSNLVRLLEWNFAQHPYFVESEYAGPDLRTWADAHGGLGTIPPRKRLGIAMAVAKAVARVHSLDILHKDLKPANIMVEEPSDESGELRVRLGDLGSASLLNARDLAGLEITDLALAQGEGSAGTTQYSAPEVLAGLAPQRASDVYALGLLIFQLAAGDFRKSLAPGWERDVADPRLQEMIASAAAGDPARRESSAAALAERLSATLREAPDIAPPPAPPGGWNSSRWIAGSAAALALLGLSVWLFRHGQKETASPGSREASLPTVAVLPLEGDSKGFGVALADEVAATLLRARGLAVRPVGRTAPGDPMRAGTEMKADRVVTGRFRTGDGKLLVSLSAIDVKSGRLIWQDSLQAPADSLIALQVQLTLRVRGGLARALGGTPPNEGPEPVNEVAYKLFLESAGLASDPRENRPAIQMLERTVALDPGFAPAWQALSGRYYLEARYSGGGRDWLERADRANQRVLALDPDSVPAAASLAIALVERGQLEQAHSRALDAVRRRPDSVEAHFALSYVLRFAGLLRESAEECETAYLLDPRSGTSGVRSCAVVFLLLGDGPRTANYLRLDEGSEFEAALLMDLYLRMGQRAEALRLAAAHPAAEGTGAHLLAACAADARSIRANRAAAGLALSDDPESNYFNAGRLAFCGHRDEAVHFLRVAIAGGYCAYPALEQDPFLASIREHPEFAGLRVSGKACQERFVRGRARVAGRKMRG
ncbi:MAG: winged helix-turn-helix domain-containing protein [Bryobacteraceae bacterium]